MHKPKTGRPKGRSGRQIVADMMAEQIVFGGMLFTRFGLLTELHRRNYTDEFIDVAVFAPGTIYPVDTSTTSNAPNEVPETFWEETAPNKLAEYYMSKSSGTERGN